MRGSEVISLTGERPMTRRLNVKNMISHRIKCFETSMCFLNVCGRGEGVPVGEGEEGVKKGEVLDGRSIFLFQTLQTRVYLHSSKS